MRSNAFSTVLGFALISTTAASAAPSPAAPNDPARIDRITLSSGGVAEVHRVADIEGSGTVRIEVPLAQVNDVLKSLLVSDPGGTLDSLTLDGLSPVEETFSTLPLDAKTIGSLPALLQRLKGIQVRATSGGRTIEGAVLGTDSNRVKTPEGATVAEHRLSVLTQDKRIDVLRLGADATVDILDAAMRDRMADAVQSLSRAGNDQLRAVAVNVKGSGQRAVGLSYITAAPVWKPAFRLVIGETGDARLQGWAVLENATGQDWKDVDLTLVSGAPVTLTQKLHDRYWRQRPEVPVTVGLGEVPRADNSAGVAVARKQAEVQGGRGAGARAESSAMMSADMARPRPAAAPMPAPMATPAAPTQTASAQENMTNVSFHLPQPVTLARGQTLSVPFVDVALPAERLAVFQPEMRSFNPVSAVMLKNTSPSTLPPGILTVYDGASGFVGDAKMPALPAGESRLASFAADRKVEITSEVKPEEQMVDVKVSEGVAQIRNLSRTVTTYRIKGASDAPRVIVIEHPKQAGWTTRSDHLDSETATHRRVRIDVAAGATAEVSVTDELPGTDTFALTDTDEQVLIMLANAPAAPALSAKLKALAQQRRTWAATERKMADIDSRIETQTGEQSRVRDNLSAVPPDSELGRRYMDLLAKSENAMADLATQRDQAGVEYEKQKEAFLRAIAAL